MDEPDCSGYWYLQDGTLSLMAEVHLDRREVFLPTSEHPYHLDDLIAEGRHWVYIGDKLNKGP